MLVSSQPTTPGLLLIRGLGHSGSTVLDLALGAHPQLLGLGEAVRVLDTPPPSDWESVPAQLRDQRRHQRRCTCGATAAECAVWGPVLDDLAARDQETLPSKLNWLIEQALSVEQGPGLRWLVESYQADRTLLRELATPQQRQRPLKVLFLVRDVRSWLHSEARRGLERRGRRTLVAWRALFRWWKENRRLERLLRATDVDSFTLGYEELALAPQQALEHLCTWLGVSFDQSMLSPGSCSRSHVVEGNRMRFDPARNQSICYDGAWLASSSSALQASLLLPPVAAMNQRLVYSNGLLGRVWPPK